MLPGPTAILHLPSYTDRVADASSLCSPVLRPSYSYHRSERWQLLALWQGERRLRWHVAPLCRDDDFLEVRGEIGHRELLAILGRTARARAFAARFRRFSCSTFASAASARRRSQATPPSTTGSSVRGVEAAAGGGEWLPRPTSAWASRTAAARSRADASFGFLAPPLAAWRFFPGLGPMPPCRAVISRSTADQGPCGSRTRWTHESRI